MNERQSSAVSWNKFSLLCDGQAMQRDLESVAGLRVLAGAVALCGLNSMPEPLARAIFSAEFMGKLDHEMDMCRDGRGYIRQEIDWRKTSYLLTKKLRSRKPVLGA
jgi:hypothetical protein